MTPSLPVRLVCTVTALAIAAPALAQETGSVRDFELPVERSTPQPRAQGPVAEGIPPPRVARPTPTPAPAPTVEALPAPAIAVTPTPAASAAPTPAAQRPTDTPTAAPTDAAVEDGAELPAESPTPAVEAETADAAPASSAPPAEPAAPSAPEGGIAWWMWLAALVAVGALGALAGWVWRGRRSAAAFEIAPVERLPAGERPRAPEPSGPPAELPKVALTRRQAEVPPAPPPPVPVAAPDDDDEDELLAPLRIALEPARLSVSLLTATLAYRILLTNQGETVLRDISIDGDMISAHASLSREEQLAAINSKLENRHLVRTLAPGETKVVNGEFALPLPLIRPIRQGEAALFVPLARLRVIAAGDPAEVLVQTSVVGQRAERPGGGLRPFRLDLGPRIYSELGQRAFA